jgi:hypothetical protein
MLVDLEQGDQATGPAISGLWFGVSRDQSLKVTARLTPEAFTDAVPADLVDVGIVGIGKHGEHAALDASLPKRAMDPMGRSGGASGVAG